MLNAIRTIIFYCFWFPFTFLISTFMVVTFFLPFSWHYRSVVFYSKGVINAARFICGLKYEIRGKEHLPKEACIILSNHQSTWETLAFLMIFPTQTWVAKKQLLSIPFFGWAFALLKPIAIDRSQRKAAMEQLLEQGAQQLKQGRWLIIFPEGTRIAPLEKKPFSKGGGVLAEKTRFPVIPVAHNAGSYWKRHAFVLRPGKIVVSIGSVIDTQHLSSAEITQKAQDWIWAQLDS